LERPARIRPQNWKHNRTGGIRQVYFSTFSTWQFETKIVAE